VTREEAIEYLWDIADQCVDEFCVGVKEIEESRAEFAEALTVLGVRPDEMRR
jgi:hypothetical protein